MNVTHLNAIELLEMDEARKKVMKIPQGVRCLTNHLTKPNVSLTGARMSAHMVRRGGKSEGKYLA